MIGSEYYPQKSKSNLEKHSIDFEQAQRLWDDANLVEISAKTIDESRSLVIGNKHWSAVITYRNLIIRIILARRSRGLEV
jgi:uncharacterized DUF497 family protein